MRLKLAGLSLFVLFGAAFCSAQDAAISTANTTNAPDYSSVNCSSFVSDNVPSDMYLISGENSDQDYLFAGRLRVHQSRKR